MRNKASRLVRLALSAGVPAVLLPLVSLAQFNAPPPQNPPGQNIQFQTISGILCTVVAWIFTILIILAVIYVLWAAYYYLSSSGDEEKIKKANHMLLYAAIALVVAILSRGVPFLIAALVGQGAVQGC